MVQAKPSNSSLAAELLQQNFDVILAAFNTINALILVLNPEGQVLYYNQRCEDVTGFLNGELQGLVLWELLDITDRAAILEDLALRSPIQHEARWTTPSGSHHLSWTHQCVRNSVGQQSYIISSGQTIPSPTIAKPTQTLQIQRALTLETTLKRITDRVRDSLDEDQILQTAVQELGSALQVLCCNTGILNADCTAIRIDYEYTSGAPLLKGQNIALSKFGTACNRLLQGQPLQFCASIDSPFRDQPLHAAIFACPILDEQEVLGGLWLYKSPNDTFDELELRLVHQVANQCAIAIRQARLYQAAEAQIEELENLNRLKDEFLSRISHELRTPVSNMRMAIHMLAIALNQERPFLAELSNPKGSMSRIANYFRVLRDECEREISLIDDLLNLRLQSSEVALAPEAIELQTWLPNILAPYQDRTRDRQQTLRINLDADLPVLHAYPDSLERILEELLDNAWKYTPIGEIITFRAWAECDRMYLQVTNSGVEISASRLRRVFDSFYWVPRAQPWEYGGTGLGLALVRKLTKRMGGAVTAESSAGETRFTVNLPLIQVQT